MNQPNRSASLKLSDQLEADILSRGFKVGEPYMTADEAGEFLGVSRATAHRAFEPLIKKGLIVSKRKMGTMIGPAYLTPTWEDELSQVKVLISIERLKEGLSYDEIIAGIKKNIPVANIDIIYIPQEKSVEYVKNFVVQDEKSKFKCSYLLITCPRSVQEFFSQSNYRAVVLGSLYPLAQNLANVSIDNFQKGYAMGQHLLEQGHRKMVVFFNEVWLPASSHVLAGLNKALGEGKCLQGSLEVSCLPDEESSIRYEVKKALEMNPPITAIICSDSGVETVLSELKNSEAGLRKVGEKEGVSVMVESTFTVHQKASSEYNQVVADVSFEDRVEAASLKLMALIQDEELSERKELFSVKII